MNRRTVLAGLFGAASVAAVAAVSSSTVRTLVGGHVDDLLTRTIIDRTDHIGGTVVKTGDIDTDAIGQDRAHNSSGTITVREFEGKRYMQLEGNFKSSVGPDYHVYASTGLAIHDESGFGADQIELGKLKSGSGSSYYEIPEGMEVNSMLLWCKRFGAYIGSANLT